VRARRKARAHCLFVAVFILIRSFWHGAFMTDDDSWYDPRFDAYMTAVGRIAISGLT
jgi:hypothetical protein